MCLFFGSDMVIQDEILTQPYLRTLKKDTPEILKDYQKLQKSAKQRGICFREVGRKAYEEMREERG